MRDAYRSPKNYRKDMKRHATPSGKENTGFLSYYVFFMSDGKLITSNMAI